MMVAATRDSPDDLFGLLSDDVIKHCFSFVGPGQYRFVGTVCHHFKDIYCKNHEKKTLFQSAATSIGRAQLCMNENKSNDAAVIGIARMAAKMERMDVIEYIHEKFPSVSPVFLHPAARHGRVKVLEFAAKNISAVYKSNLDSIIRLAADHGHVNILDYVYERRELLVDGCMPPRETFYGAWYHGQVPVLAWMKEKGLLEVDEESWCRSARKGQVNVLEWLVENGYSVHDHGKRLVHEAVVLQNVNVLQWAEAHGVGFNEDTFAEAAYTGNVAILQWLLDNECPSDGRVVTNARRFRNKHALEWAMTNGWLVTDDDLHFAEQRSDSPFLLAA